jgi:SAM-dependent methyltransferase
VSVFGLYSGYYDLLYQAKDYASEAAFVSSELSRSGMSSKSILDLGCGTGRHSAAFAEEGYKVHGIDISDAMLAEARVRQTRLVDDVRQRMSFGAGDVRTFRSTEKFGAAVSLFHVFSYQTTNTDLASAFATASAHLDSGAPFAFDFWYGPAVLAQRPETRVRRLENERIRVLRIAESTLQPNENRVDVYFTVLVEDKETGERQEIKELHPMRYLFLPEIDQLLEVAGMERFHACEWMTRADLGINTWSGFVVARKTAYRTG